MKRRRCEGVGSPAVERRGDVFPYCPRCGKQLAAQGRKAQRRFSNAWATVPSHFVAS